MRQIDFSAAKHLPAVARILELARSPRRCVVTRRATDDIVKLRLTKDGVLGAVRTHLEAQSTTYVLRQNSDIEAYVLLPCTVEAYQLYVKVQVPPCPKAGSDVLVVISAHTPRYEARRKSGAKRKK